jgi:hypothetical protein
MKGLALVIAPAFLHGRLETRTTNAAQSPELELELARISETTFVSHGFLLLKSGYLLRIHIRASSRKDMTPALGLRA